MIKLRNGLFRKKRDKKEATYTLPAKPKYDFVEQYTILDPKRVMNGGYNLFSECETIPVLCEEADVSPFGFRVCKRLPTNIVIGFLEDLNKASDEQIADPKMRTISMIHLSPDCRFIIGPNIASPKHPAYYILDENDQRYDWVLHVTPEKNRAIVEQMKIHTR